MFDGMKNIVVVLVQPQNSINIGNVLRAMMNMGVCELRLVDPRPIDRDRASISGRQASELLDSAKIVSTLEEAIEDTQLRLGCTARPRRAEIQVAQAREIAPVAIRTAHEGKVAVVMGREDRGLTNEQLDLCDVAVVIPTNFEYSSLNLAQALVIMLYELYMVAQGAHQPVPVSKKTYPKATGGVIEGMIGQVEKTLWKIEFFKSGHSAHIMRTLREVFSRADLNVREVKLLRGMFMEVVKWSERKGF